MDITKATIWTTLTTDCGPTEVIIIWHRFLGPHNLWRTAGRSHTTRPTMSKFITHKLLQKHHNVVITTINSLFRKVNHGGDQKIQINFWCRKHRYHDCQTSITHDTNTCYCLLNNELPTAERGEQIKCEKKIMSSKPWNRQDPSNFDNIPMTVNSNINLQINQGYTVTWFTLHADQSMQKSDSWILFHNQITTNFEKTQWLLNLK